VRALGVLKNWIDRRELRAIRVGQRRVRIREADLDDFLHAPSTAPEPRENDRRGSDLAHIDERLSGPLHDLRDAVKRGAVSETADALAIVADVASALPADLKDSSEWPDDHELRR
jgi:excisionase family DNA binding protein